MQIFVSVAYFATSLSFFILFIYPLSVFFSWWILIKICHFYLAFQKALLGLGRFKTKMSISEIPRLFLLKIIIFWIIFELGRTPNSIFNPEASCYLSDLISWYSSKVPWTPGTSILLGDIDTMGTWNLLLPFGIQVS